MVTFYGVSIVILVKYRNLRSFILQFNKYLRDIGNAISKNKYWGGAIAPSSQILGGGAIAPLAPLSAALALA